MGDCCKKNLRILWFTHFFLCRPANALKAGHFTIKIIRSLDHNHGGGGGGVEIDWLTGKDKEKSSAGASCSIFLRNFPSSSEYV